jgi:hypothetical protein
MVHIEEYYRHFGISQRAAHLRKIGRKKARVRTRILIILQVKSFKSVEEIRGHTITFFCKRVKLPVSLA